VIRRTSTAAPRHRSRTSRRLLQTAPEGTRRHNPRTAVYVIIDGPLAKHRQRPDDERGSCREVSCWMIICCEHARNDGRDRSASGGGRFGMRRSGCLPTRGRLDFAPHDAATLQLRRRVRAGGTALTAFRNTADDSETRLA